MELVYWFCEQFAECSVFVAGLAKIAAQKLAIHYSNDTHSAVKYYAHVIYHV